ncbi:MAG: nicotinamide riboside transporter PnuC [Opitutaceae bacterium]|jgi:nicotinamide mononucleotide transporter|nr:nicotinamide riboside transporter PnuC [Opitutaceae bacterium]
MNEIIKNIADGFASASRLDLLNLLLGVLGVWLMTRRKLAAFPVGLLAVSVQGILFFKARFYADALLQVFFFATLAWGWRHWVRDRGDAPELPVTRLSWPGRAAVLGAAGAATLAWGLASRQWTDAPMPFRDAFIAAFSVAAQVLQARKNVENWALWVVVDLVAIASYWSAAMAFTAFLYLIYLALGLSGWAAWARTMRARRREAA